MSDLPPLILVIDDSQTINNAIVQSLEVTGFRAIGAESGIKGFGLALDKHPDLILLDITMPGIDGYGVKHLLEDNENTREIPVIFVTGHAEREDKVSGLSLGVDDYITKPFDMAELCARVAAVLRRSNHHA